jgi:hypothetical protein
VYKGIALSATTKINTLHFADNQFIIADSEDSSAQQQFPPLTNFDRFSLEIFIRNRFTNPNV